MRSWRIIYIGLIACLSVLHYGCKKRMDPKEYKAWVENPENGYVKMIQNRYANLKAQMETREYSAARLFYASPGAYANLSEAKEEIGENTFFVLQLTGESEMLSQFTNYIFFGMEKDLVLILEGDTIANSYYLAEPQNGVSPYQNVVVGFPLLLENKENFYVHLKPNEIFPEGGQLDFEVRNNNIPKLKIN